MIDYQKEDFTGNGQQYDLIIDTKTARWPFAYLRSLNPGGSYVTVGGLQMRHLLVIPIVQLPIRLITRKTFRLVGLKPNRDLPFLNERFESGELFPVIDGPYPLSAGREAFLHFGAAQHKGKVVFTID